MKRKHIIGIGAAALVLVAVTAGASTFIARGGLTPEATASASSHTTKETISWNNHNPAPAPAPAPAQVQATNCDDGNIVGNVIGGVGGGIVGSQVGKGKGQTAATIGGTLGGAWVGGKFIPTKNVTCR